MLYLGNLDSSRVEIGNAIFCLKSRLDGRRSFKNIRKEIKTIGKACVTLGDLQHKNIYFGK
jgi:hypothetical protein